MKCCSSCKREFEATTEYFAKKNSGLSSKCKECAKEYAKKYRESNKEKIKENSRLYYKRNAEKINLENKIKYNINKEKILEKNKEYYYRNREKIREEQKKYRENHFQEEQKRNKRYRELHKEEKKNYFKIWAQKNPEKVRIKYQKRIAKKVQLPNNLTETQWEEIKKYFDYKCAYCSKEKTLEQDHFIPLSKGGEYTQNNIIPACRSCNGSKMDKDFFEWYPKYKYYTEERKKKILNFLNYKKDLYQQLTLIK